VAPVVPKDDPPTRGRGPTCCPGGLTRPIDRQSAEELAHLFKAVADPARLQLLSIISSAGGEQVCSCDLYEPVGLRQPTVSHHLKILVEAGLLNREQRGTWAWFSIIPERLDELSDVLSAARPPGKQLPVI
jgi:ArsR family transcriptional regulator